MSITKMSEDQEIRMWSLLISVIKNPNKTIEEILNDDNIDEVLKIRDFIMKEE